MTGPVPGWWSLDDGESLAVGGIGLTLETGETFWYDGSELPLEAAGRLARELGLAGTLWVSTGEYSSRTLGRVRSDGSWVSA